MRSKTIVLIIACLFPAAAIAQRDAPGPVLVPLSQGGFVSIVNRPEWIDPREAIRPNQLPGPLGSQVLPDANQTIHRILRDRDGGFVFGYDLWISADWLTKQFKIAIRPLDSRLETSLRPNGPAPPESPSTFPRATEAQTLNDGSEFSVDLLVNQNTGVKMVDIVKVSFDRSSLGGDIPALRPRDFSADAVAMEMKDYSLFMNDELVTTGKSKTGSSGALLWLYVPQRGRLIFSLVPRPDYAFEKVGTVSGNKIEFSIRGDHFAWLSSAPILREEGTWNLWVLSDPKYLPLMGANIAPPAQEKGTLEKLDEKVKTVKTLIGAPPVSPQLPKSLTQNILERMEKNSVRDRVWFGAADHIENLLPRN
jgi:hypothetical protein